MPTCLWMTTSMVATTWFKQQSLAAQKGVFSMTSIWIGLSFYASRLNHLCQGSVTDTVSYKTWPWSATAQQKDLETIGENMHMSLEWTCLESSGPGSATRPNRTTLEAWNVPSLLWGGAPTLPTNLPSWSYFMFMYLVCMMQSTGAAFWVGAFSHVRIACI